MVNGIENPIEVSIENGNMKVYNGNHRLKIAEKLGLNEIPVKYIDDIENVDSHNDIPYNDDINTYTEGETNGNISRIKKSEKGNDKSGNNVRTSINDSKSANIKRGISRNDGLSNSLPGYNDRTSSNTTSLQNDTSKKSKEGLDNSSFSINENNTWQEHLEENYKSKGTRTYFEDTKFNKENDSVKHLNPTKESSYGPVKKKGQIYNLDKVIEFM